VLGVFFCSAFYYNHRVAQIELDPFTDEYLRGTIMNASSGVATLTVIVLFTRVKLSSFRPVIFVTPLIAATNLVLTILELNDHHFAYIVSVALRYVSGVCFSIFLIWAIESYPTVCRTRCVGMVFCGTSLGSCLAYGLRPFPLAQQVLSVLVSCLAAWLGKYLRLDYEHRLMDTLSNKGYDKDDQFKRV
jgi:hypothetical protein